MARMTLVSPRGTLTGSSLEAEIEFRTVQLRKRGARRSVVDVVGTIEEETVLQILAAARLGARVVLTHPRWTLKETSRSVAHVQRLADSPSPRRHGDFILFTSGTEGEPKPVELTAAGFEAHAKASSKRLPTSSEDRWLLTLAPAHVGGLAMILRVHFQGGTLVVPPSRTPKNLSSLVQKHQVTHVSLVPTQLQSWLDAAAKPPTSLRCVLVGGAPCPVELESRARANGWPIRTTYGLTEASSQVATQTADSPAGSVGPPIPGAEIKIDAPPGQVGRIHVKSPATMLGYLGREHETRVAFANDWLRTPDLGRVDEQGNLWVLGRADDVIISGGENIDPAEVEHALERHPQIQEACVVGVPHPKWGQTVQAVAVAKEPVPAPEDIIAYAKTVLASYKVPRVVTFWPRLPRTTTGKLQRARVRSTLSAATVPT